MRCINDYKLTRYMDKGYSSEKMEEMAGHLARCRRCRHRLEAMRRELDLIDRKTALLDPAVIPEENLVFPINTRPLAAAPRATGWGGRRLLKPALALFLLFGLGVALWLMRIGPFDAEREREGWQERRSIIEYVKIGGRPAQTYIIKEPATHTTLIWVERKTNKMEDTNERNI